LNQNPDPSAAAGSRRVIARSEHPVSRSNISPNALRVLYRLKEAGFQAFLVGGCVRDIILGLHPKDFDVATDALPEQVRRLFRNCRLVGRRFRLAHIVYGREVIEVATFRAAGAPPPSEEPVPSREEDEAELLADELAARGDAGGEDEDPLEATIPAEATGSLDATQPLEAPDFRAAAPGRAYSAAAASAASAAGDAAGHRVHDDHGRLLRDNMYGSVDDDVWRRDFTVNALYYNIADFSIWDYVGGLADIKARRLRLIGDVETRYREDPVRMLRAARFEAKLGFELDAASAAPIPQLRSLLAKVPPARLFDETVKLFLTGHGAGSFRALRRHGLFAVLFPAVDAYLEHHPGSLVEQLLVEGLRATDRRVAEDKPVTPTFLFSLLLYGHIASIIESLPKNRWHEPQAILEACDRALREAQQRVSIPRRIALGVREMYALQPRLEGPRGRRALRLLEQPRFRAAYDLLSLRAGLGLADAETAQWWTTLQAANPEQREQMVASVPAGTRAAGGGSGAGSGAAAGAGTAAGAGAGAPRRRRRRSRSRAG
jgi:poly(A) polymerase